MNPITESRLSPLAELSTFGQSVWLDYIRRGMLSSGELARHVREDGLAGVTSNPAIFEKAIAGSEDYSAQIDQLLREGLTAPADLYDRIAVADIQDAADVLRPVFDRTGGGDGYVSLEVSPYLARDTEATIREARRLWGLVNRPNLMVKVPAAPEGVPAIRQLIGEGINVNVTLLFAVESYQRVAEAYLQGLETLAGSGADLSKVASVASFFVSRIDSAVDPQLATSPEGASLAGKVAIANAKMAYVHYQQVIASPRWRALESKGAHRQRLLWASTGTKNPRYSDVLYVEELIGPDTVNTMPPSTFEAFRDHGRPRPSLTEDVEGARRVIQSLPAAGVSLEQVTAKLLDDGVKLFSDAFDKLLAALDARAKAATKPKVATQTSSLGEELSAAVNQALDDWERNKKVERLWARDASLWTGADEGKWLGWLSITEDQLSRAGRWSEITEDVRRAGFEKALLLGMGGSSLAPEVMSRTFGRQKGSPELLVLDSTDPAQVRGFDSRIDPQKTLFIVSSKSGSTLEPNILKQYFFERAGRDGSRFLAITDPGSKMQEVAEADRFRHVFFGWPSIGGRYSALSDFGMVPSAVTGVDVAKFLDRTEQMVQACHSCVAARGNPGVLLGAVLGTAALHGRDKITLIASPPIYDLGAWLEQLLAESTGKQGKGLIPVDREPLGPPEVYGKDRLFVYERFTPKPDRRQDAAVEALEKAGHPVVRIAVDDLYDLGQEFFRWEIATAVAGSLLGINAFNQPDVEASKVATRALTDEYEKTGALPAEEPFYEDKGVKLFADPDNAAALLAAAGGRKTLSGVIKAHLNRIAEGDYFALLAYIPMNAEHEKALQAVRARVRDRKRAATCLGFGPRFLHSTGQAYKGGPNSGVFLQVTCEDAADLPVPGQKYTFGVVKAAQARGDFQVLSERRRRALRAHVGPDLAAGLKTLRSAVTTALR